MVKFQFYEVDGSDNFLKFPQVRGVYKVTAHLLADAPITPSDEIVMMCQSTGYSLHAQVPSWTFGAASFIAPLSGDVYLRYVSSNPGASKKCGLCFELIGEY